MYFALCFKDLIVTNKNDTTQSDITIFTTITKVL
jgi:hypothetical protein